MKDIKGLLVGTEYTTLQFDNIMEENGFYSEFDSFDEELLESGSIIYTEKETFNTVLVEFEVTEEADEVEDTYISVKNAVMW